MKRRRCNIRCTIFGLAYLYNFALVCLLLLPALPTTTIAFSSAAELSETTTGDIPDCSGGSTISVKDLQCRELLNSIANTEANEGLSSGNIDSIMMQLEFHWMVKEMDRYNGIRGKWPLRSESQSPTIGSRDGDIKMTMKAGENQDTVYSSSSFSSLRKRTGEHGEGIQYNSTTANDNSNGEQHPNTISVESIRYSQHHRTPEAIRYNTEQTLVQRLFSFS